MARDATLRVRPGLRGQGRSRTAYFPLALLGREQGWGRVSVGEQSRYSKTMGSNGGHPLPTVLRTTGCEEKGASLSPTEEPP